MFGSSHDPPPPEPPLSPLSFTLVPKLLEPPPPPPIAIRFSIEEFPPLVPFLFLAHPYIPPLPTITDMVESEVIELIDTFVP